MIYYIGESQTPYNKCSTQACIQYLEGFDEIQVDTETRGFDPHTKELLCLQLGDPNAEKQYVIDVSTVDVQEFKALLESKLLLLQNAKFDLRFLYKQNIIPTKIYDTYLAETNITLGDKYARKALDYLVYKYCKINLDKTIRGVIHKEGLSDRVIKYAAEDVQWLSEIKRKQLEKIKELGIQRAVDLDNAFVGALAYVEFCGFKLSRERWKHKMDNDFKHYLKCIDDLNQALVDYKLTKFVDSQLDMFDTRPKSAISWNSSQQVIPLMKYVGVDTSIEDKQTGELKDSVESKHIQKFSDKHPIVPLYIEFKKAEKNISTYGDNFLEQINPATGRIHTTFKQILNTGRMSSGDKGDNTINIQNIPRDPDTRSCFIPEDGNSFVVSDYSGQLALLCGNV